MARIGSLAREYWFYLLLPFCLMAGLGLSRDALAIQRPLDFERVLMLDFFLILPTIYFFYLRKSMPLRGAFLRSLGLAGLGLWFAAWLMPAGEGQVIPQLAWLRYLSMPFIILVEIGVAVSLLRYIYGEAPDEQKLIDQGVPPLVVKALLMEARFWKEVWRFFFRGKS